MFKVKSILNRLRSMFKSLFYQFKNKLLHLYCKQKSKQPVRQLKYILENGNLDLNEPDSDGYTALHHVTMRNN